MLSAVIFDLDGTVIENEDIWEGIFHDIATENGIKCTGHIPGIGILQNWRRFVSDEIEAVRLAQLTRDRYLELKLVSDAKVRAGFEDLVEYIKERSILTALATASNWDVVEDEIERLNLILAFDIITTGEEVLEPKPDPEIYTLTCQKMGIEPERCLVIEDSIAGVEAASAAGCHVVGIISDYSSSDELKEAGAAFTVDNLNDVVVILTDHGDKDQI